MRKRKANIGNRYITKWLSIFAVFMMLSGFAAYGLIILSANLIEGSMDDWIWIVGMIPLMAIIVTPINLFISNKLKKHLDILSNSIDAVVNGEKNVYISTAKPNTFNDIYEKFNKLVAEIESIQVFRTELVDSFSHELKTPIASINGFAKLLSEEDLSEAIKDKYLKIIIKESDRLAILVKNSLLLSRIDSQEIISNKSNFSLNKQIQECIINLENDWSAKNLDISFDIEEVMYFGDSNLMESVWNNLLTNAIKYNKVDGEINVKLDRVNSNIIVTIADTGIGMSSNTLEHIFDRYYQAEEVYANNGHGLGLSIVKRIIELCDGSINVESKVGEGSKFIVTLPVN